MILCLIIVGQSEQKRFGSMDISFVFSLQPSQHPCVQLKD
jgi:hypothetical protein